jgi:phosphatidylethanolamine-binding protein (PEBP) family uncharacterized protein
MFLIEINCRMKMKSRKSNKRKPRNRRKTRHLRGGNMLEVFYENQKVAGQELPKPLTQSTPLVKFPTTGKLYSLIMWDPDVPPQIQPGFVHWIVTNLQSQNDIQNNQVLEYKGPAPPSGIHRYYFGLFEQSGHISVQQPQRPKFSINEFVKDYNLRLISDVFMRVAATNV